MYKIKLPNGIIYKTEYITYIKHHSQNCYLICEKNKAEGIVFNGTHYFFKDGLRVQEYDSFNEFSKLNNKITEQEAFFDEMAKAYVEGVNSIDE